jgi:uncharacterized membrane protein
MSQAMMTPQVFFVISLITILVVMMMRRTKTQNMMMYQILCGHVNYALGKTRMQVKKKKTLYFGFMFILIS